MAVIQDGTSGAILASVVAPTDSLSCNIKPYASATLGSYACSLTSGVMAAGLVAASEVWQFRYGGANLCIVEKVILDGAGSITAFTAGSATFRMFLSRSYTASGGGGTAAVLTGNNCKLRTSYATTAVSDIRIASTLALTSPAGDVPDSQPCGGVAGSYSATAGAMIDEATLFDAYGVGHPIILAQNEGLILQATVPAAGTWTFGISVRWAEVTAAEWGS